MQRNKEGKYIRDAIWPLTDPFRQKVTIHSIPTSGHNTRQRYWQRRIDAQGFQRDSIQVFEWDG